MFKETDPILGTRDIQRAIAFYTQRLGFKLAFADKAEPPNTVGFRRDAVELHMQFITPSPLVDGASYHSAGSGN